MQALMGGGVSIVFFVYFLGFFFFIYLRIYPYNFKNFFFLALCQVDYSIPWLRSNFTELWPHAQSYIPKYLIYSFSLGIQRGHPPRERWTNPEAFQSSSVRSLLKYCSFQEVWSLSGRLALLKPCYSSSPSCHNIALAVVTVTSSKKAAWMKRRGQIRALASSLSCWHFLTASPLVLIGYCW